MDVKRRMKILGVINKIDRNAKYAEKIGTKNTSTFLREKQTHEKGEQYETRCN